MVMDEQVELVILNNDGNVELGRINVLQDAGIYERVNNKYTFDFSCYEQPNINLLNGQNIVFVDDDYFRVAQIEESPIYGRYDVSCEHVSYELNTPKNEIKATYEGYPIDIVNEILTDNNTRFTCTYTDFDDYVEWGTTTGNVRSRILEFATKFGFEVKWYRFEVRIITRRGHDYGLEIELGKNLKDLKISRIFDFDGNETASYDIDFIDLNKLVDINGDPLEVHEFHLGDTVYLKFGERVVAQRGIAVGYNPFRRELPTIELESPVKSLTDSLSTDVSNGSNSNIYQEDVTRHKQANAFGYQTKANGQFSFTSGVNAEANGFASTAFGLNAKAVGNFSLAVGINSEANANASVAFGDGAIANGVASLAVGYHTQANGSNSVALGNSTQADDYALAMGMYSKATGNGSFAGGHSTEASGYDCFAFGTESMATEYQATAFGYKTLASGYASFALGQGTLADGSFMLAGGTYNKPYGNALPVLLALGNGGDDSSRSNAFRVDIDGQVYAGATFNSGGADYAEYFEWSDGNVNNEDRRGYVVALDGDKIRLALHSDDYILGIVSVNPSIVGNAQDDQWSGMYLKDEWGTPVYDEEGKRVINPAYDSTIEYVPRSIRHEWSPVGMLGKLIVRDDGTCQINKYAKVSQTVEGILTMSNEPSQFFVLRRINENLVEVLVK